ncbi:MAG: autotransporter outer membrane beta-barrel domain-containing protein, partial [Endomicrobium sp.]|nr:autotransporter outer membrane beta-barrel domain-containing protein [Endomicrobium sp.]
EVFAVSGDIYGINISSSNADVSNAYVNISNGNISSNGSSNGDTFNTGDIVNYIIGGHADNPGFSGQSILSASINSVSIENTQGLSILGRISGGDVYSENSTDSETITEQAHTNSVSINNSSFDASLGVHGGYACILYSYGEEISAATSGNSVLIANSSFSSNSSLFIAGGTSINQNLSGRAFAVADNNNVLLNDNSYNFIHVYGGYTNASSQTGINVSASGNSVSINNGTFGFGDAEAEIHGGWSNNAVGPNSSVVIFANNNSVSTHDLHFVSKATITGAFAINTYYNNIGNDVHVEANNNTVTLEGNFNVFGSTANIIGGLIALGNVDIGYAQSINNTVNIGKGVVINHQDSVIYGGLIYSPASTLSPNIIADAFTGNTLNIAAGAIKVAGLGGFENYNFHLNEEWDTNNRGTKAIITAEGDGMNLITNGAKSAGKVNLQNTKVKVYVDADLNNLHVGDSVNLIDASQGHGIDGAPTNRQSVTFSRSGIGFISAFDIFVNNDILYAKLLSIDQPNPQTKTLSEGYIAGAALINHASDIAVDAAIQEAALSLSAGSGDIGSFAAFGGGQSKYKTGSHVDVNSFGISAGLAKAFSKITAGVFAESGSGSYNTFNSFANAADVEGKGNTQYAGGGLLGLIDFENNFYTEASLRAGNVSNEYDGSLADIHGNEADYKTSAFYYGLHIGGGYKVGVCDKIKIDGFGKIFYNAQNSTESKLGTDEIFKTDPVSSIRARIGAKAIYELKESIKPYLGISAEYETDGEVKATLNGAKIDSPSLSGTTAIGEIGIKASIIENLKIDIGVQGYAGQREGISGFLQLQYKI